MTEQRPGPPYTTTSGDTALRLAGAEPLQPGDPGRIGPYVLLGLLGSGGMGRVYLARPADDRPGLAALKVIRPEHADDPEFRRRFEREAGVHGRVGDPYAPALLGTGYDDGALWMATGYLPGINLTDAVRESGRLAAAGVWRLVGELGGALAALSAADVVHRDLKPSNVILTARGAHLIDFGISQAMDGVSITETGSRVGTPAFMSPEYLRDGRCDTASDVFSLAGTVVYAATGHAPFGDGTGVDIMHRVAFEQPKAELMAEVAAADPALAALMAACLAKDPADRPTPLQLRDTAAAHPRAEAWQEPLYGRLLARQQGTEVLERATERQTDHLRTQTMRVAAPAAGAGPAAPPGAYGPALHPGPYGASGAHEAPGRPDAYGSPGSFGPPTPPTVARPPAPPPMHGGSGEGVAMPAGGPPSRGRRKRYLAIGAGLAVCAVAVSAFLLTRSSDDDHHPAAAASKSASAAPSDASTSSALASPRTDGSKGKTGENATSSLPTTRGTKSAHATPGTGASPTAKEGGTTSGGQHAPSPTATRSTTPPWISKCTYYSGTALTQYGDTGNRVVQVQCMLSKRGYSIGAAGVDGDFGTDTRAAVKRFQTAKSLEVDGQVGPHTWAALRSTT